MPTGFLSALSEATGKSRSELKYRRQFAERFPTPEELANALANHSAWRDVVENLAERPEPTEPAEVIAGPLPDGIYRISDAAERLFPQLSRKTIQDYAYVARESSIRIEDLSFKHHQVVAPLPPEEQAERLTEARDNGWSVTELRNGDLAGARGSVTVCGIEVPPRSDNYRGRGTGQGSLARRTADRIPPCTLQVSRFGVQPPQRGKHHD